MREHFVIDPLISKRQQLLLATQLCRMVLKVRSFWFSISFAPYLAFALPRCIAPVWLSTLCKPAHIRMRNVVRRPHSIHLFISCPRSMCHLVTSSHPSALRCLLVISACPLRHGARLVALGNYGSRHPLPCRTIFISSSHDFDILVPGGCLSQDRMALGWPLLVCWDSAKAARYTTLVTLVESWKGWGGRSFPPLPRKPLQA